MPASKIQHLSVSNTIFFWSIVTATRLNAFVTPSWLLMDSFQCSCSVCATGSVTDSYYYDHKTFIFLPPPTSSSPLQDTLQQLIVMPLPNILCVAKDPISGNTHSHTPYYQSSSTYFHYLHICAFIEMYYTHIYIFVEHCKKSSFMTLLYYGIVLLNLMFGCQASYLYNYIHCDCAQLLLQIPALNLVHSFQGLH